MSTKIAADDPAWKTTTAAYGSVDIATEYAHGMRDYASRPTSYADTPAEGVLEQTHHIKGDVENIVSDLHMVLRTAEGGKPESAAMGLKAVVANIASLTRRLGVVDAMQKATTGK